MTPWHVGLVRVYWRSRHAAAAAAAAGLQ